MEQATRDIRGATAPTSATERGCGRGALRALVAALVLAVVVAGCGGDDATSTTPSTGGASTTTSSTAEPALVDGDDERDEDGDGPVLDPAAARAAVLLGARLDQLAAAYAPVTARINFLVTADTLWRDGIATNVSDEVGRERAGAVRIEIERMEPLLAAARRGLVAQRPTQPQVRRVQRLLLAAIAARTRALGALEQVLDAEGTGSGDTTVEQLDETFRDEWDASLRAAREATTAVQDTREGVGLDPDPEEALR